MHLWFWCSMSIYDTETVFKSIGDRDWFLSVRYRFEQGRRSNVNIPKNTVRDCTERPCMSPVCLPASSSWSMGCDLCNCQVAHQWLEVRWRYWGSGPWRGMATCYNITSMLDSTIESNMIIYQYGLLNSNIMKYSHELSKHDLHLHMIATYYYDIWY